MGTSLPPAYSPYDELEAIITCLRKEFEDCEIKRIIKSGWEITRILVFVVN